MPSRPYVRGRAARALLAAALACGPAAAIAQGAGPPDGRVPEGAAPADSALAQGGERVTVAGRALVGSGVLHDRALMLAIDRGGQATWLFSRTAADVRVRAGDSVEATGVVHRYRGTTEIVAAAVRVVEAPLRVVEAPASSPASTAAVLAAEGRLVRVRGRVGPQGASEGGRWLRLLDDSGVADSVTVWIPATHQRDPRLTDLRLGDDVEVTGIAAIYRDNPSDPAVAQLVPRGPEDVRVHGIPGRWRELALRGLAAMLALAALGWALVRAATRRQASLLRETQARYHQLLELSPDAVIVHAEERVLFANPAAARLLGVGDEHALAGVRLSTFLGLEERAALSVAETVQRQGVHPDAPRPMGRRLRTRLRAVGGEAVDVEAATSPCRFSDRDAAVIVARDIGPQLRYERELRELALLDELTGLHNRRGFLTFAEAELRRLRQAGHGAALLFADLDGLKRINDAHGHAAGDEALTAVAHALREVVGAQGLVARWSGDEFAALVHEPPGRPTLAADALLSDVAVAEAFELRLRAAIERRRSPLSPYGVSASVGAHHLPPDGGETLAAALAAADAGLYERRAARRPARA
jgi:diguanylate cyclase (GGDEF)-like protein/PAS domain S-box-containing protein